MCLHYVHFHNNWVSQIQKKKVMYLIQTTAQYTFSANVRHPTGAGETKVLGRVFWRPIFTIENCLRNYWKLPSSFALIDVSLNSLSR